jgi:signal transduction histidine kinase
MPKKEPRAFRLLAWVTTLLCIALLATGLVLNPGLTLTHWPELLAWGLLVTVVDLLPVASGDGPRLDMDLPILLACAFLFGAVPSGIIALVCLFDAREFTGELSLTCAVYNRSQKAISVMTGAIVFEAMGAQVGVWPTALVGALVALATDCATNYTLVTVASVLLHRGPSSDVLSRMKFGRVGTFAIGYACLGLVGLILAETYLKLGLWALLCFPVPLILARQAFAHGFGLEAARKALADAGRAFQQVSARIADERRDERSRIASSLHDDVLQSLYNVTIHAQVIREDLRAGRLLALDEDVPALLRASDEASNGLRGVIKDLRSSPLGRRGLIDTLSLLLDHLQEESTMRLERRLGSVTGASPMIQLVGYQVAKEAVTNSLRHSRASVVCVTVEVMDGLLVVAVDDDGVGLPASAMTRESHFGLQLMRERVSSVGGRLTIEGRDREGTSVLACLPLKTERSESCDPEPF